MVLKLVRNDTVINLEKSAVQIVRKYSDLESPNVHQIVRNYSDLQCPNVHQMSAVPVVRN